MTPSGIEPATFRFVAQYLNHCATAPPPPLVDGYQDYFPMVKRPEREGTSHLHLMPKLRMSVALPLVVYVFIAWEGITLTFIPIHKFGRKKGRPDIFIINYSNSLVYDAVSSCQYFQLFRRNFLSPSSW
jgi:hypothetical protein